MLVRIANREDPDQIASLVFRSSLTWVCTVCLDLFDRQQVFEILENLLYCLFVIQLYHWTGSKDCQIVNYGI